MLIDKLNSYAKAENILREHRRPARRTPVYRYAET